VVSSDIPEVHVLSGVRVGTDAPDFITQIELAVSNPGPRDEVSDAIRGESWEAKIEELREIIAAHASRRG
jgi:hypothetical protein